MKGALTSGKKRPRSAIIDSADVGQLLRDIDTYNRPAMRLALQFLALTFVRPGELCSAEWREIDFDAAVWSIPPEKMKMRDAFRVPLSRQAVVILKQLRTLSGDSKYASPSRSKRGRPTIYPNRINIVLRRLGYDASQVSAHGSRSTASTILKRAASFRPTLSSCRWRIGWLACAGFIIGRAFGANAAS